MAFKRSIKWIASIACSLLLCSCSFNPFSADNHLTGNPAGAAAGGIVGGTVAGVAGASKGIIIAHGIAGAAVGYYLTTMTFQGGAITKAGGQIFSEGDYLTIVIPTDQLFDSNTADLLPRSGPILDSTASILNRFPDYNILITGSTSGFGTQRYERKLSEDRARQVAAWLWNKGIDIYNEDYTKKRRLIYIGYGDHFPIANTQTNSGIRMNSRIQINVFPVTANWKPCHGETVFSNVGDNDFSLSTPGEYKSMRDNTATTSHRFSDEAPTTDNQAVNGNY